MAQSRRDFIRISALGSAGIIWGSYLLKADSIPHTKTDYAGAWFSPSELNRTPTYCEICFWKCAGWVHKDDKGEIQKITGNDADPNCNGRFCPRGTGGVGMYYDQDRLKTPLIRT